MPDMSPDSKRATGAAIAPFAHDPDVSALDAEAALVSSMMAASLLRSRLWLLLVTVASGFLMILVSVDFSGFAPFKVSAYFLYALMTLAGVLVVHGSRDTRTLLALLVAVNAISLAIYVGAVMVAMRAVGIPLQLDLVVAWTLQPVFTYSAFGVVLGFFGVLVGMVWHPW